MNIKEIIDAERWMDGCEITTEDANEALDRIESAVTAYVAELEEALDVSYNAEREALKAELENQNHWHEVELRQKCKHIAELELRLGCCRDASAGKDLLIAELEEQVPRDVVPETGSCECGGYVLDVLGDRFAYCPDCGAKLDWSEA